MSRESLVFILGAVVLLMPYLGVPADWKRIAYTVCGASLVVLGYSLRRSAFFRAVGTAPEVRSPDSIHNVPHP